VLVDGVPVDNGNGNFSVNDIPIDKIDRIEIYKSYVPERLCDRRQWACYQHCDA
jgi:TonB-dependent Receptor Plug Domain.